MTTIGPTFDLGALARYLVSERKHLKLAGAIEGVIACHSLQSDLVIASETLDELEAVIATRSGSDSATLRSVEQALLSSAIVLYARATKTTSRQRKVFDPRSKFTAAQLIVHQELCDLRDDAIAHFGSGGSYLGEWQAETAMLQCIDGKWKVGTTSRRQSVDRALLQRLRGQIAVALDILRELYRQRNDAVIDALHEAYENDPSSAGLVASFPLNLGHFLKDPKVAAQAFAGFDESGIVIKGSSRHS
jgi:hypothetical protein